MTGGVRSGVALAKRVLPTSSKEVVRRGLRRYGTVTARRRPLPDYLVIGAKRGGTTSLWRNLRRHPQVMSMFPEAENLKSPHFFDIHWAEGEAWYRSHFPTRAARDRRRSAAGGRSAVGDVSPYYLFHPRSAERAAAVVPDARIVAILRHPVDRAWSHYHERRKDGTEPLSFADALAAEESRLADATRLMAADPDLYSPTHDFCSYLARGRYLEQLRPWLERFPAESILVLRSETYYRDPEPTLREVVGFLGLDASMDLLGDPQHLNRLPAPTLDAQLRSQLNAYYRPHVDALQAALGRDFGWDLDD